MGRYVLRRLLQMVLVLIGTTFLIFTAVWSLPGDPFASLCGDRTCPPNYVAKMRAQYHADEPLPVRYYLYMKGFVQGDLGETFAGRPVLDAIVQVYPPTLRLALLALFFEIVIGLGAGILTGLRRGGYLDNLVLLTTLLVISMPVFVIGFLARLVFGIKLQWFSVTVGSGAPWSDLILPAAVLASLSLAYVARLMRTTLAENLRADYVRTATAKGLPHSRVIGRHAVRNSLIPVITYIGADFGVLLGGAIVTERIFDIHGVGSLTYQSINRGEVGTVVPIVTLLVLVFLLVNLLVDLLYAALDPRIRYS